MMAWRVKEVFSPTGSPCSLGAEGPVNEAWQCPTQVTDRLFGVGAKQMSKNVKERDLLWQVHHCLLDGVEHVQVRGDMSATGIFRLQHNDCHEITFTIMRCKPAERKHRIRQTNPRERRFS